MPVKTDSFGDSYEYVTTIRLLIKTLERNKKLNCRKQIAR